MWFVQGTWVAWRILLGAPYSTCFLRQQNAALLCMHALASLGCLTVQISGCIQGHAMPACSPPSQFKQAHNLITGHSSPWWQLNATNFKCHQQSQIWGHCQTLLPVCEINLKPYAANNPDTIWPLRELNPGHVGYWCQVAHSITSSYCRACQK